jgi:hypothetical protein
MGEVGVAEIVSRVRRETPPNGAWQHLTDEQIARAAVRCLCQCWSGFSLRPPCKECLDG